MIAFTHWLRRPHRSLRASQAQCTLERTLSPTWSLGRSDSVWRPRPALPAPMASVYNPDHSVDSLTRMNPVLVHCTLMRIFVYSDKNRSVESLWTRMRIILWTRMKIIVCTRKSCIADFHFCVSLPSGPASTCSSCPAGTYTSATGSGSLLPLLRWA